MQIKAIIGDSIITEEYVSIYTKYWDIRRDGEEEGIRKGKIEGRMEEKRVLQKIF